MEWENSQTIACRYGDNAFNVWKDWKLLWENSFPDYQGQAKFLAKKDEKYVFYEWTYGSCSGCDGWESEGLTDSEIEQRMKEEGLYFDSLQELSAWISRLDTGNEFFGIVPVILK